MLSSKNLIPDARISERVSQLIAGRGLRAPCRVTVKTLKGEVTLSGTVQYSHQKAAAVQVSKGSPGVRRVIDRLTVMPAATRSTP
jgi:osmotically-inducible protein OsmY